MARPRKSGEPGASGFDPSQRADPRRTSPATRNPANDVPQPPKSPPSKRPREAVGPSRKAVPDAAERLTHHHVVRLSTTRLDHDREIASIVRAMGRKKWALESRQSVPGASRETVSTLTFVQETEKRRAPNAPVPSDIVKVG